MIDHIGLRTAQFDVMTAVLRAGSRSARNQEAEGLRRRRRLRPRCSRSCGSALSNEPRSSIHLALSSADQSAVRAFHAAALKAGAKDNGAPGPRDYAPNYYAAFVIDPDGNNIEAVCHSA